MGTRSIHPAGRTRSAPDARDRRSAVRVRNGFEALELAAGAAGVCFLAHGADQPAPVVSGAAGNRRRPHQRVGTECAWRAERDDPAQLCVLAASLPSRACPAGAEKGPARAQRFRLCCLATAGANASTMASIVEHLVQHIQTHLRGAGRLVCGRLRCSCRPEAARAGDPERAALPSGHRPRGDAGVTLVRDVLQGILTTMASVLRSRHGRPMAATASLIDGGASSLARVR